MTTRSVLFACLCLTIACPVAAADGRAPVRSLSEIRNDKVVRQEWDLSCGAAALATLLKYQHGVPVTEREVAIGMMGRAEYLENPDILQLRQGFSLLDMKRYVETRGFRGVGLGQLTFDDLVERAPIIIPVDLQGYPHFVVFRGAFGDRVLIADSGFGNRTMRRDRLEDVWVDLPNLGQVGFAVLRPDDRPPPNQLVATERDFLFLR
ncbi:C39 family peptidase [Marinivivus vitaminiproducens]|uniref:C39 family peptidase n=1 Tax=Marinivivus vitaminiproducens TaxID=3035935 RepID=UPI0027AB87EE|nr:C39 family peptidase [Geminicoccaceae bacterium SCSIO 64248]